MGFLDFFVSEQEKSYRRGELLNRFTDVVEDYCDSEDALDDFTNSEVYLDHNAKYGSVGIAVKKVLPGDNIIKPQFLPGAKAIKISDLKGFEKVRGEYQNLKNQNIPWGDIFEALSDSIVDLLVEAVTEFEKKYSLPKRV